MAFGGDEVERGGIMPASRQRNRSGFIEPGGLGDGDGAGLMIDKARTTGSSITLTDCSY